MRVWFVRASQPQPCQNPGCEHGIQPGEFVLRTSSRQGKDTVVNHWHPECLVEFSRKVVESQPVAALGRKPLPLNPQQREGRLRLLQRYAANKQRIARYKHHLPSQTMEIRIHRLLALQRLIEIEMAGLGGVPRSWLPEWEKEAGQKEEVANVSAESTLANN